MSLFVACWFAAIGAFRSSLLFQLLDVVLSQVRFVVDRLLGVANGKCETLRDGETVIFLYETETFSIFKVRDRAF